MEGINSINKDENFKYEIEKSILSTYLFSYLGFDSRFESHTIPYKAFNSTKTIMMVSKAIFNAQSKGELFDEGTIFHFLSRFDIFCINEWQNICSKSNFSYETMLKFEDKLIKLNSDLEKIRIMESVGI